MRKSNVSILFATFSAWEKGKRLPTNGSVEPLRDFLVPRVHKFVLIDQLVPGSVEVLPKYEVYTNQNSQPVFHNPPFFLLLMTPLLKVFNTAGTQVIFKLRDFISVIGWGTADNTVFDYLIGLESINALAGIVLRKLGRVKRVVYYVSDYSPHRYPNKIFNALYLWLDRFAAIHSDYIWDVSLAIQPARIAAGLDPKKSAPVIHVANGLYPDQIKASPLTRIEPHTICYMGTVGPENGPDIAIKALAIIRKKFPDATLHIIGGKPNDFSWLFPTIKRLHLGSAVKRYGFVPSAVEMAKIMRSCAVGLAPYRAIPGSPRYYGDAGKIRAYCAAGLAVVSSEVPPLGRDAAEKGAAIIVRDDPQHFAQAIAKLFVDKEFYRSLRSGAVAFARDSTWENQFSMAFKKMNIYL